MKKPEDNAASSKRVQTMPWELANKEILALDESGWHDPDEMIENSQELVQREWMKVREVAEYLGVSVGTIYNYVSKRKIPHSKKGGLKFSKSEIDEWMLIDEFSIKAIKNCKKVTKIGR